MKTLLNKPLPKLVLCTMVIAMLCTTFSISAFADYPDVAQIGEGESAVTYTSLSDAVSAAKDGDTVKLIAEVGDASGILTGVDSKVEVGAVGTYDENDNLIKSEEIKDITIDLNGYNWYVVTGFSVAKGSTATLTNNGSSASITVIDDQYLSCDGTLYIKCDVTLQADADENGQAAYIGTTAGYSGKIYITNGATVTHNGTSTIGNATMIAAGNTLYIEKDAELINNGTMSINYAATLYLTDGTLTNYGTFSAAYAGWVSIDGDSTFKNEESGTLNNAYWITIYEGADVSNSGTVNNTGIFEYDYLPTTEVFGCAAYYYHSDWSCYEFYSTLEGAVTGAIEYASYVDTVTIVKDAVVSSDIVISEGITVAISEDVTLTVNEGVTVDVQGSLTSSGTIENSGTIQVYDAVDLKTAVTGGGTVQIMQELTGTTSDVEINKDITITGTAETMPSITSSTQDNPIFKISGGANVTFEYLTLNIDNTGIKVTDSGDDNDSEITITNCDITDNNNAGAYIVVGDMSVDETNYYYSLTFTDNTVTGAFQKPIHIMMGGDSDLIISGSTFNCNNNFTSCTRSITIIVMDDDAEITITNNSFNTMQKVISTDKSTATGSWTVTGNSFVNVTYAFEISTENTENIGYDLSYNFFDADGDGTGEQMVILDAYADDNNLEVLALTDAQIAEKGIIVQPYYTVNTDGVLSGLYPSTSTSTDTGSSSSSSSSTSTTVTTDVVVEDTVVEDTTTTTTTTTSTTTTSTDTADTADTTEETVVEPVVVSTVVETTVQDDGVTQEVSTEAVTAAIEEVIAAATATVEEDEEATTVTSIVIDVAVGDDTATDITAALSSESVTALVEAGIDEVVLAGDNVSITIDAGTLATMAESLSGSIKIVATDVTQVATLSEAAAAQVGSNAIFTFSIEDEAGNKVSDFNGGAITVSIPYTLGEGELAENIVVYYIDEDGNLAEAMDTVYDAATGMATFTTTHFSTFAVVHLDVEEAAVEDLTETGVTTDTTEPAEVVTEAASSNVSVMLIGLFVVLALLGGVVYFVVKKRSAEED